MLALDPYYEMFPSSYQRPYPYYQFGGEAETQQAQNSGIDYGVDYTVVRKDAPNGNLYRVVDFVIDPTTRKLMADVVFRLNKDFKRGARFPIESLRQATEDDRRRAQPQVDPFVGGALTLAARQSQALKVALGVSAAVAIGVAFFVGRAM